MCAQQSVVPCKRSSTTPRQRWLQIASRGLLLPGRLANMGDPKKGGARDNTQYTCWTAPSFSAHHGMCISAECVYADALLLSLGAMRMKSACARA